MQGECLMASWQHWPRASRYDAFSISKVLSTFQRKLLLPYSGPEQSKT